MLETQNIKRVVAAIGVAGLAIAHSVCSADSLETISANLKSAYPDLNIKLSDSDLKSYALHKTAAKYLLLDSIEVKAQNDAQLNGSIDYSIYPIAPQDKEGNYYIDIGAPYHYVRMPTTMGGVAGYSPQNLDRLRYFYWGGIADRDAKALLPESSVNSIKALEIEEMNTAFYSYNLSADDLTQVIRPVPASTLSKELSFFQIVGVSSAARWPEIEPIASAQTITQQKHGDSWVGVTTWEIGTNKAPLVVYCGKPMLEVKELRTPLTSNTVHVGWERAWYAASKCESGLVSASAMSFGNVSKAVLTSKGELVTDSQQLSDALTIQ